MAHRLMARPAFGAEREVWTNASPVSHVRSGAPPFLMINAAEDEKLEEEAEELAALLRKAGTKADTFVIPGTDHFTILGLVGSQDDTLIDRIVDFVEKQNPKSVIP
jgi:acetyl esterase/lipase